MGLSCEGQIDVWELFYDNSYLSAVFDRQGLLVAAKIDLGKKKARHSCHKASGTSSRKNPKIVVMSPIVETQSFKKKEVVWQQYHLCMDVAEHQIIESRKNEWLKKVQYLKKKYHCQWTVLRGERPKWIFTISAIFSSTGLSTSLA